MVVLFEVPDGQTSSTDAHRYDVFLSFRGLDTRYSFTNHLHKALIDANITTFLDDEEIETGEDLKPELENAIKASRASVIVLSKNYATSTWCLDELVLILEQRITFNQIVIPIFYHVEPTHVRWQEGSFGDAMAKHKRKMDAETDANKRCQWAQKMDRWNKALFKVANLKGNDVKGRLETEFIDEIVKDIYRRLRVPLRSAQPLLIGMDHYINFVTSWLKNGSAHRTDILTILGMGGIGKTSLAKYVYELHCRDREFDTSSYIKDVSRTCDGKFNGLLCLQKQFCDDILKTSPNQVHDVLTYTSMIENAVAHKKVFLVLDDIDSIDQLDALLGSKGFHPGSKIIITTKDTWVTENCALLKKNINMKHEKLLLQGLDEDESLELLCFHAFMSSNPKEGYEEVSDKLVKYCQGHPLALEVLGKSLHNRDVAYWEGCIEGLMKETYPRINNVLKMSFNSLPSNNDKELFKHIACFFVGMDRDVTETILEACGINTRTGMTNLIEKFFVRIDCDNKLMMHQLLQEMGKSEVCQESPLKPWKRSRIWCNEESFRVLKQNKGNENLVGLALDMRMLGKEKLRVTCLKTDALMNMDNLKLLQLNYVQMDGSYKNFPEEIRWLCMHGFLLKSIPSDLPMENLVALDLSCSNIESFAGCHSDPQRLEKRQKLDGSCLKDKRLLGSLKILNLSFCNQLRTLCDFEQLPALEKLIVTHCVSLVEVCESIGQCIELVFIDMSYCKKLEKLPRNIGMLKKVRTLLLDGCNLGESQSMNIDMDSLVMYKANNNIGINTRASSSAFVGDISRDLKYFASYLPSSVVRLSLAYNNLSTESFPVDFSCLFMLKELSLDENPIVSMPHCVRTLPRLERLSMVKCENLKSVEHPPHTLKELSLYSLIEKVVFDPEMSPLELSLNSVEILHCSHEIQGVIKIQPIVTVEEKVLRSLDWTNLDLFNRRVGTSSSESEIQMIYEFGIFSTIYEDEEMPSRFLHRSAGPSISFTIPSSPNNIRGLNLCSVQTLKPPAEWDLFLYGHVPRTPMMTISNITKNRMWIYERFKDRSTFVGGKCWVMLSHWMFGRNEMEAGDHVTITLTEPFNEVVKECGVSLVYEDGEEEEEDVLAYYKSWNHIIGGDLSHFQTTTGEYMLNNERFFLPWVCLHPYHRKFVPDGPKYQEKESAWFRALSPRKPDIV